MERMTKQTTWFRGIAMHKGTRPIYHTRSTEGSIDYALAEVEGYRLSGVDISSKGMETYLVVVDTAPPEI